MYIYIYFKHTKKKCREKYNASFKYETKPVGGGKQLFEWVIDSTDSFKRLIHSEMTVFVNGLLNHWLTSFVQTADSFRNNCLYEWVTDSLTHLVRSNGWFVQKWLSLWMGYWIIDSLDSFKRLIHSEMTVFMNGLLNHWLTWFVQMADSFRNDGLYERVTESSTHLIRSNSWFIQKWLFMNGLQNHWLTWFVQKRGFIH